MPNNSTLLLFDNLLHWKLNKGWQTYNTTYKLFLNEQQLLLSFIYFLSACCCSLALACFLDFSKKSTDSPQLWSFECRRCRYTPLQCWQGVPAVFQSCCSCSLDLHGLWVKKRSWRRVVHHAQGLPEAARLLADEGSAEPPRSGSWALVKEL